MIDAASNIRLGTFYVMLVVAAITLGIGETGAQQQGDAQIAPRGELRIALQTFNPTLVTRSPEGEFSGVSVDLAKAFGKKLGLPVRLVPYENIVKYNQSIGKEEWDVALSPRDLSRAGQLAFSEPFMEVDNSYVARPGLLLRTSDEIDRASVKVAVAQGSATDGFLSRTLRSAEIVRLYGGLVAAREALTFGRADVYADYTHLAYRLATEIPGASVLVGRFNVLRMTMAVPKSNTSALHLVDDFIQHAKQDGLVAEAIKRAGIQGARVGPGRSDRPVPH